jgi:hypothetical protein
MAGGVQFLRSFYNRFKKIVIDRCVVLYGSPWSSGESQPERRKSGRAMAAHFLGIRLGELFLPEPSALLPHVRPLGAGHAWGKAYSWPRQAPVETTRPATAERASEASRVSSSRASGRQRNAELLPLRNPGIPAAEGADSPCWRPHPPGLPERLRIFPLAVRL